ncbi:MAG: hypothetical protein IIA58_02350 [Candidatus Marinimicrobia bacterium]|nr:hypothetical protein [Candidatus Neomarinimicrobiota bacterium]
MEVFESIKTQVKTFVESILFIMDKVKYKYQGVARTYQRELLDDWYSGISSAKENDEKVAYLFISGNTAELLKVFDFHLVYPEANALQCGVKKVAGDFNMKAEDIGYSSKCLRICKK